MKNVSQDESEWSEKRHTGHEDEQKVAARNQENLDRSALSNTKAKLGKEAPILTHAPRANIHTSDSQQEFFKMLDEKIERIPAVAQQGCSNCLGELRRSRRLLQSWKRPSDWSKCV
ncbi:uncharacterized protein C1orf21 homolog isoform X3 [Pristis pectinata]|nr:uncharacterized protein C1orf21 homolog isoform X3 [Pristis pectinata]XP_051867938.1 uncharacterized protein C1orf21 homolog isoform X3 [Pristis pectinata]XP_051867939.1 uncharacterized protein C1orf21 homolog isoform X3 [Pristis pectinata]XP_051867940.1 uncharacterized protein C1orf21 homolog isoform X3 [Pristis pectinata]